MEQKDKVGAPSTVEKEPVESTTNEAVKTVEPGIVYPRCPFCPPAEARQDGTRPGDPLQMMRLRYDFPDGIVAEVLFCKDCRAFVGAAIVGYSPAARR